MKLFKSSSRFGHKNKSIFSTNILDINQGFQIYRLLLFLFDFKFIFKGTNYQGTFFKYLKIDFKRSNYVNFLLKLCIYFRYN
nr:MAG TPA: hypothetical protein [Caudoviricetes sp.]